MIKNNGCFDLSYNIVFCLGLMYNKPSSPDFTKKKKKCLDHLFSHRLDLFINMSRKKYTFCSLCKFLFKRYFFVSQVKFCMWKWSLSWTFHWVKSGHFEQWLIFFFSFLQELFDRILSLFYAVDNSKCNELP